MVDFGFLGVGQGWCGLGMMILELYVLMGCSSEAQGQRVCGGCFYKGYSRELKGVDRFFKGLKGMFLLV